MAEKMKNSFFLVITIYTKQILYKKEACDYTESLVECAFKTLQLMLHR